MSDVMNDVMQEIREERMPFEMAVEFLFGSDVPEWVGSAVSDEECQEWCQRCPDRDFCWFARREDDLSDLVPEW